MLNTQPTDFEPLSKRTRTALERAGISSLRELCGWKKHDILSINGLGSVGWREIDSMLNQSGLFLRTDMPHVLVEPFFSTLRDAYLSLGDFGAVGERFGITRQAAYELYIWSERATKNCVKQREAHVRWATQTKADHQ